jgi:probable F420-dependent oxidoreductase
VNDLKVGFGIQLPTWANFSWEENVEYAKLAEDAGFDYICVPDHFFLRESSYHMFKATYEKTDPTRRDMFEPWITLGAVAAVTKKVRIGPGFTPLIYYNPGLLARIIATIDQISNGRFIMGAGVGWNEEEAKCYDIPYASFMTRYRMMKESLRLMKKLWIVDGPVTFKGKYYKVENAPAWPKPVQKPYPPTWSGGSGSKIMAEVGKIGDGWGPGGIGTSMKPAVYTEKMNQIKAIAKQAGRNPENIVFCGHAIMSMEKDHDRAFEKFKAQMKGRIGDRDFTEDELKISIVGTTDDCIAVIERYVKAGLNHFVSNPYPHPDDLKAWFTAFKEKIIPYFNT